MKRKIKLFVVLLLAISAISFSSESKAAVKVVTIKTSTTYKIFKGEKLRLYVKGYKSNKKAKKVKWKSSNKKIATVSKKGIVTGKKGGTCKITATVKKKKYTTKVFVFTGEKVVYEHDEDPEEPTDRYNTDIEVSENTETIQYNEWMSATELEEKGLFFVKMSDSIIHITGQSKKDSLTGNCESYSLELPENIQTDIIYGDKLRFKWNGSEILYNTDDMKSLELIVNS